MDYHNSKEESIMGFFAHPPKRVYSSLSALGMGKVVMTRNACNALYPHGLDLHLCRGRHLRE